MKHFLIVITAITLFGCNTQSKLNMAKQKKEVGIIEVVIFKTNQGFSEQEVIEAANAVNPVVKQFEGFISRKLAVSEDGTWTDIVYWTDLASAKHAGEQVMKSKTCQKFFSMIDEKSMQFMHQTPVIDTMK